MRNQFHILLVLTMVMLSLGACNFSQVVEVELPPYESKLVVECYLEPGSPAVAVVSESVTYFAPPEYPFIENATVVIRYNDQIDTLYFFPDYNVYISLSTITVEEGIEYFLEVEDPLGRRATATTRHINPVEIESLEHEYGSEKKARVKVAFNDPAGEDNYYRITMASVKDKFWKFRMNDDFSDGQNIVIPSSFNFKKKDTVNVKLYHLTPEYYLFLKSLRNAEIFDGPITEPAPVVGNIDGGLGIFTTLSYDLKTIRIPKK